MVTDFAQLIDGLAARDLALVVAADPIGDDVEPARVVAEERVLVDLALADGEQLLVAEVDVSGAAAEQDSERLGRLAAAGEAGLGGAEQALLAVEVVVELLASLRLRLDGVLEVGDAEGDVAGLILRRQADTVQAGSSVSA